MDKRIFPTVARFCYGKNLPKRAEMRKEVQGSMEKKNQSAPILITIGLVLLDQLTKLWALKSLKPIHNTTVIPGVLDLTFVENRGVAFGLFSGQKWFILILTGLIAGALVYFYRTLPQKPSLKPVRLAVLLVLSGAIGNIIDRIFRSYVVDFFEFTFFDWPVFNVADIYVVVGVILLTFLILFVVKDEDLSREKTGE